MTTTPTNKLIYLPLDQILDAEGICNVYKNRYWIFNPEHGLVFCSQSEKNKSFSNSSPQCNRDIKITEHIKKLMYQDFEIKFVEMVIVPVNPKDYC